MRFFSHLFFVLLVACHSMDAISQNIQVETLHNLNASGGVTFGPDGNIYVSDFGEALGQANFNTKVYKITYGTWEVSEFASGFSGASGSRFDSQGNFYQSNPSGGQVSKISTDGELDLDWVTTGMSAPIGIVNDEDDNLYVCNCGNNTIRKITPEGTSTQFASSVLFNCPNGITRTPDGSLYACNFSDGRILRITPDGDVEAFVNLPVFGGVGNGHITYSNGFLFVAAIGVGQIFKVSLDGESQAIAGKLLQFGNQDGPASEATFSKPNGIAASRTGDTLWVNTSVPTWISNNLALHPGRLRMITGICSLEDVDCPLLSALGRPPDNDRHLEVLPAWPNPAVNEVHLHYVQNGMPEALELSITDPLHRQVYNRKVERTAHGEQLIDMDVRDWQSGVYTLILRSDSQVVAQRIVVQ